MGSKRGRLPIGFFKRRQSLFSLLFAICLGDLPGRFARAPFRAFGL